MVTTGPGRSVVTTSVVTTGLGRAPCLTRHILAHPFSVRSAPERVKAKPQVADVAPRGGYVAVRAGRAARVVVGTSAPGRAARSWWGLSAAAGRMEPPDPVRDRP